MINVIAKAAADTQRIELEVKDSQQVRHLFLSENDIIAARQRIGPKAEAHKRSLLDLLGGVLAFKECVAPFSFSPSSTSPPQPKLENIVGINILIEEKMEMLSESFDSFNSVSDSILKREGMLSSAESALAREEEEEEKQQKADALRQAKKKKEKQKKRRTSSSSFQDDED